MVYIRAEQRIAFAHQTKEGKSRHVINPSFFSSLIPYSWFSASQMNLQRCWPQPLRTQHIQFCLLTWFFMVTWLTIRKKKLWKNVMYQRSNFRFSFECSEGFCNEVVASVCVIDCFTLKHHSTPESSIHLNRQHAKLCCAGSGFHFQINPGCFALGRACFMQTSSVSVWASQMH